MRAFSLVSETRTGCANERPSGSVRGVPGDWYPYRDRQPLTAVPEYNLPQKANPMPWTLTSYLERRAKEMPNLKVLVFGTTFYAFAAGAFFINELEEGHRTPLAITLGWLWVAFWLAMSLECSYLLLRAVRRKTF